MEEAEAPSSETNSNSKPKVVVVMGPTGSGKSKLAIDLASHFPIEIINADSMQVYRGLDVLTNKVPPQEQKGVPHHLLGTISPTVEFTAKDFRDSAIPLINEIHSRNHLPVIVGGTNYYIQALVSPFLLDESVSDEDRDLHNPLGDKQQDSEYEVGVEEVVHTYNDLKDLDPVAANRIHPNDHRKINQYLQLYSQFGVLPSKLLQDRTMEKWGRVDDSRYKCCFICVDAALSALDEFVNRRVDRMVEAGLLDEVLDIYKLHADYTRGLRQAIGVREFEDYLRCYIHESQRVYQDSHLQTSSTNKQTKQVMWQILEVPSENPQKVMLTEAIDNVKLNTRRLVRRQKRRLSRLQMLFGWDIRYVDATEPILSLSDDIWAAKVVEPSVEIIKSFLDENECSDKGKYVCSETRLIQRDLWTQHVCKACGDKVLRGAHEWEQHTQGRSHRKRMSRLKKLGNVSVE